jgi:hypothetical protein
MRQRSRECSRRGGKTRYTVPSLKAKTLTLDGCTGTCTPTISSTSPNNEPNAPKKAHEHADLHICHHCPSPVSRKPNQPVVLAFSSWPAVLRLSNNEPNARKKWPRMCGSACPLPQPPLSPFSLQMSTKQTSQHPRHVVQPQGHPMMS